MSHLGGYADAFVFTFSIRVSIFQSDLSQCPPGGM